MSNEKLETVDSKKEQCKRIMKEMFGPNTASSVDDMSEENCAQQCRDKVLKLVGERLAKKFDHLL